MVPSATSRRSDGRYTLENPVAQAAYIHFELYPTRMTPSGCPAKEAKYRIFIKQGATTLVATQTSEGGVILNATSTLLAAGTFNMAIWSGRGSGAYEVLDYTIKVYSEKGGITIKDGYGSTNEVGVRDDIGCS